MNLALIQKQLTQNIDQKLRGFERKVAVYCETDSLIVKTAENPFELRQALALRHEVFYRELQNKELEEKLDSDEFDFNCDHIIIIDKSISRIVGTYRVSSTKFARRFYSQTEFALDDFFALPGEKLELGRACIKREYRNGSVINLLWKGIAAYARSVNAELLFGCASVQSEDACEIAAIEDYLSKNNLYTNTVSVKPLEKYQSHLTVREINSTAGNKLQIPALIQSYIVAGAKFYGAPAHDKDFECHDFFMALQFRDMHPAFRRRYGI